jgi:hypothetical protein
MTVKELKDFLNDYKNNDKVVITEKGLRIYVLEVN